MKPLKVEKLGVGFRLAKAKQRQYVVNVAILYAGKPMRQTKIITKAPSRDMAAKMVQDSLSFKVVSAHADKKI